MYRAVVVFDVPYPSTLPLAYPKIVTLSQSFYSELKGLTDKAKEENWANVATLLKIRQCSNGEPKPEWEYTGDLLDYFYPISRSREQVLRDALSALRQGKASSS